LLLLLLLLNQRQYDLEMVLWHASVTHSLRIIPFMCSSCFLSSPACYSLPLSSVATAMHKTRYVYIMYVTGRR